MYFCRGLSLVSLYIMQKIYFSLTLAFASLTVAAQDTIQHKVAGRQNATEHYDKPYVILISADGFRYDYADKYKAKNLQQLRRSGVKAKSMIPSFPSVTFPNHYSIATGLYPSHHGLVYNQFYDRNKKSTYKLGDRTVVEDGSWYGGTPLWVLAEKQGMLSASYHFVGTEAPIQGLFPTYWYRYSSNTDIDYRIDKVVDWLRLPKAIRPHLVMFYISNVDHEGHMHGPGAWQTKEAVKFVDKAIGRMVKKVNALGLPVNFIFLSDHGMANVDTATRINITALIDTARFITRGGNTSLHLYAKDTTDIIPAYTTLKKQENGFSVYLPDETPANWHYKKADDRYKRIGDIFIVPHYPKVLSTWNGNISPGAHGFDPALKEMHATFYAWGPQIKKGLTIAPFENVHVYPFVCSLLGINYTEKIDGDAKVLEGLTK
jgi:predicted AlkP superfamily pyrophosphatase or phosphodiesterase